VVDYDDSKGREFSRQFTVFKNADGSVVWTPGDIKIRGKIEEPMPATQDITELRHKSSLAAKYPREEQAAQQYSRELQEEKAKRQSAESAVLVERSHRDIWCRVGVLNALKMEISDIANSFGELPAEVGLFPPIKWDLAPPALRQPLSDVIFEEQAAWNSIASHVWRFRRALGDHCARVRRVAPDFKSRLIVLKVPTDKEGGEILSLIESHAQALGTYAAALAE